LNSFNVIDRNATDKQRFYRVSVGRSPVGASVA